ncbi:LysR substrate-binding domain-containing protein [Propylenella binzhouense]|uniref:LysR substrate-binding domain-containing protein n=1 Tax=Propylenella binzhouense TaxID=2555902 RepID=UPI001968277B
MSLQRLSLRDLEYIVAVADERHFGRAAEKCHVSQPALSAQVRKLEDMLGHALFERTARGVLVTSQGERLVPHARELVLAARRFLDLAAGCDRLQGALRIDAIATLGPYLFPYILRPLRDRLPEVDLVLRESRTETILNALVRGESDIGLVSLPLREEGLATIPLFDEPFVAVHAAGRDIASGATADIDRLDRAGLLLLEEGHCLRDQALALCSAGESRVAVHATSLETLCHMVAAGAGYSLLPALAVDPEETFGGLVRYTPIADSRARRRIGLAYRATDPRRPHFEAIAETIRENLPAGVDAVAPPAGRSGEGISALPRSSPAAPARHAGRGRARTS